MKERFEAEGRPNLIDALARHDSVAGNVDVANALAEVGVLVELSKGDKLIAEGSEDNDVFFILAGAVAIVIKGTEVARRYAGRTVGEMGAIEPTLTRAATAVALETVVALKVSAVDFNRVGESYGGIWRPVARDLAKRLFERNKLIPAPNASPRLFIISSTEALAVAHEVQSSLTRDVLAVVWTNGVFFAGGYSLEVLEREVERSDFAVAVAQPDDVVEMRGEKRATLRDNVLFELGLFMGKLTRHRTILVHPRVEGLRLPTDLQGLTLASYAPGGAADLPARLGPACNEIRKLVATLGVRTLDVKPAR